MMRAVERLMNRAALPVHFSQGFNPRAIMSLVLPRPVSVASLADLLVIGLDTPVEPEHLLSRLNEHSPQGLRALRAVQLPPGVRPRALRVDFQLTLEDSQVSGVTQRLAQLRAQDAWPIVRPGKDDLGPKAIDLRTLVADVALREQTLTLSLSPQGEAWARPGEVLELLGLDARVDLAKLVRVEVDYGLAQLQQASLTQPPIF